jgi:glutaminyl-peptide cyclotransferase
MLTRDRAVSPPQKKATAAIILAAFLMLSCASLAQAETISAPYSAIAPCDFVESLEFNGTNANASVTEQVELGPRTTGSNGSAALRALIHTQLPLWDVANNTYTEDNITFTNVVAKLAPETMDESTPRVVIVAHYDSRDVAERDPDINRTMDPIPGANDAASGVAVLLELGRIIPFMDLAYEVELLFTDAEDQNFSSGSLYGSKAWANAQSDAQVNRTTAFIVVDMVGDEFLQLTHVYPGDVALWTTIAPLASAIGLMDTNEDCNGNLGRDIVNLSISTGVIDDHVPALNRGIHAIDLIDIRFGEGAEPFGGYWHTHEDTPDKVRAESLRDVGLLVELGLRSEAWIYDFQALEEPEDDSTPPEDDAQNLDEEKREVERHIGLGITALIGVLGAMVLMIVLSLSVNLKREQ